MESRLSASTPRGKSCSRPRLLGASLPRVALASRERRTRLSRLIGMSLCSRASLGGSNAAPPKSLMHSVKINHEVLIILFPIIARRCNFCKIARLQRCKIKATEEILTCLLYGRITKQNQFLPDFKRSFPAVSRTACGGKFTSAEESDRRVVRHAANGRLAPTTAVSFG